MPIAACKICEKDFYVKPSHEERGWGKYCSITCRSRGQLLGSEVACKNCGKKIYRSLTQQKRSLSGDYFCTKSCKTAFRNTFFTDEKHPNWTNGKSAYREILSRTGVKQACVCCNLNDKRVLAVHHIDHNRQNNDKSNLVWICMNCHYLLHHDKRFEEELKRKMT